MLRAPDGIASIGIDLGTSSSLVSVWTSVSGSQPETLDLGFSHTRPCQMRSAVAYLEGGVRVVGDPSFHDDYQMARGNVFYYTKRLLAKRFNDPEVQRLLHSEPFGLRVTPSSNQPESATCLFNIQSKGHTSSQVRPEQISAAILSMLKNAYEQHIRNTVSCVIPPTVVITVPANFTNAQRKATLCAAEIAGIEDARLINEPTAAAFGHYLSVKTAMPSSAYVLVFDLGGGTLDVTITHMGYDRTLWLADVWRTLTSRVDKLSNRDDKQRALDDFKLLKSGSPTQQYHAAKALNEIITLPPKPSFINVMSCDGDAHLGGQDFDRALADTVHDRLYSILKGKYPGLTKKEANTHIFDVMFELRLLRTCEEQKQMFTSRKTVHIGVKFNKITRKTVRPPEPPVAEFNLAKRPVGMTKLSMKGSPRNCEVHLVRQEDGWAIVWKRSGLSRFLSSETSVQLNYVTHVDGGSTSKTFQQYVSNKLLPEKDLRRVISLRIRDGASERVVDFAVTKNSDADTSTVLNARWEMWMRLLRCVSLHYEEGKNTDSIVYERAASANFDFESITVTRGEFEVACQALRQKTSFDTGSILDATESPGTVIRGKAKLSTKVLKVKNLWTACLEPLDRALAQAGLRKEDIDEVMLVGGSTRLPRIQAEVRRYFKGCAKTRMSFNQRSGEPVKAVAVGAAYYGSSMAISAGASLRGQNGLSKANATSLRTNCIMTDVASKNIMLKVKRRGGDRHLFFTLIRKGEFLPFSHSHVFHPKSKDQQTIFLEIYDCGGSFKSRYVSLRDEDSEVQKIGELRFDLADKTGKKGRGNAKRHNANIRGSRPTKARNNSLDSRHLEISITFMMDSFGVLTINAKVPQRAHIEAAASIVMNDRMVLTKAQVVTFKKWEAAYLKQEHEHRSDHAFSGVDESTFEY